MRWANLSVHLAEEPQASHITVPGIIFCIVRIVKKTFSERYAKIREQASRIAELEENIRQAKNCVEMVAANPRCTKIVKTYSGLALEVLKGAGK